MNFLLCCTVDVIVDIITNNYFCVLGFEACVVCQERIWILFCLLVFLLLQKTNSFPTDNRKRNVTETDKMVDKSGHY